MFFWVAEQLALNVPGMTIPSGKDKGSLNNKLAILSVEAPVWQGAKTQEYQDILSFRNAVRRDVSALKMSSYFCASPKAKFDFS
jgi:hypothetical protein